MLHQNTVFHSLLKHVPWHKLEQSVEKYAADKLSRELTTKRHVIALLYGQFCGAASLREIVTGMASQQQSAAAVREGGPSLADEQLAGGRQGDTGGVSAQKRDAYGTLQPIDRP